MHHELFVIDRKPELNEQEKDRVAYLRDKLSTAEGLGLKAQARSIKADIATFERSSLITTAPMTDTELTIWQAWLPTIYSDIQDDTRHRFANYHFDRIPQPVLKMWEKHKQSGLFERFEIWTPEDQRPDPILVGINGNVRHLLARWGESDANLVSFDDIKRELVRRWHKNEEIGGESYGDWVDRRSRSFNASLISAVIAAFPVFFGVMLSTAGREGGAVIMVLGFTVAVSTFMCVRHHITKKLWASSALMQAIVKDNSQPRDLLPSPA